MRNRRSLFFNELAVCQIVTSVLQIVPSWVLNRHKKREKELSFLTGRFILAPLRIRIAKAAESEGKSLYDGTRGGRALERRRCWTA